jgi:hypothetical protein
VRRHNNWKFLVVIKIFKARLLATTYANDKALVTTGLTQYTEKAKQKHCQHNIVAVPYLFYQPASLLWFINSETTKQEVSTTLKASMQQIRMNSMHYKLSNHQGRRLED